MNFFKSLLNNENDSTKNKLSLAIREIEINRMNLLNLKNRLEARCKDFLEMVKEDASAYEIEYSELKRAVQIVGASELALNQLSLRLEALKDLGDAVYHLSSALKAMKKIDRSVSELLPSIEGVFDEFNSTFNEAIVKLKITPPSSHLDLNEGEGEDLIEEAIKYVEKKTQKEILTSKEELVKTKKVALLATGESMNGTEPVLSLNSSDLDGIILNYVNEHRDNLNLIEASTLLDIPLDEVKYSILRLLHEGKISFKKLNK